MKTPFAVLALAACLCASACDTAEPGICTQEARAGIVVEVRDARTGAAAATDAIGIITEGSFAEKLETPGDPGALQLYGVYERAGTYTVMITKAGYRLWREQDVRVERDECHVQTVVLEARIEQE